MDVIGSKNVEKRIRKIEKTEEKSLKILYKQKKDLVKALQENEKVIEVKVSKGSPQEEKMEQEIYKLTKVILFSGKNSMDYEFAGELH